MDRTLSFADVMQFADFGPKLALNHPQRLQHQENSNADQEDDHTITAIDPVYFLKFPVLSNSHMVPGHGNTSSIHDDSNTPTNNSINDRDGGRPSINNRRSNRVCERTGATTTVSGVPEEEKTVWRSTAAHGRLFYLIIINSTRTSSANATNVEVKVLGFDALIKILSRRRHGQLIKAIAALEDLHFTILHTNITTIEQTVLYSFNVKVANEARFTAEDIATSVQQIFTFIHANTNII
uniref:Plant bHLH transcription factor ACT-like domain-containing protein n=1 Tax=Chenopodium quinoa TaxID=63459 RepID=A0A803MNR9_CHEQI